MGDVGDYRPVIGGVGDVESEAGPSCAEGNGGGALYPVGVGWRSGFGLAPQKGGISCPGNVRSPT